MRTNHPSDGDSDDKPQRVDVRRVGEPRKLRIGWRVWLLLGALALAGLAVFVLILGVMVVLLPWLLLVAAVLIVAGWVQGLLAGRRRSG